MFEVGKKVVCIDDSSPGNYDRPLIKKGEIYTVLAIETQCSCGIIVLDVGIKNNNTCEYYCKCGKLLGVINPGGRLTYCHTRFRPVDYSFADQVLEEIFEHELVPTTLK